METTARNLKDIGEGKGNLKIKSPETLDKLAEIFDIVESDINAKAIKVADEVLRDLYKPKFEKMELVEKLAYAQDIISGRN